MTSSSSSHETYPQGDNNQNPNMSVEDSTSRPTSPHTPPPSDRKHEILENSLKTSPRNSCTPPLEHSSSATGVALASTLTVSRYFSTVAQNSLFSLMTQDLPQSTSQHSFNSVSLSSPIQVNPKLTSPFSSSPQSPAISSTISSTTSLDEEKENLAYTDAEMDPSPIHSAAQGCSAQSASSDKFLPETGASLSSDKSDAKSASEKDALRTFPNKQVQHGTVGTHSTDAELMGESELQVSNNSDTEMTSVDRYETGDLKPGSAFIQNGGANTKDSSSRAKGKVLTSTTEIIEEGGTYDDVAMKDCQIVTTLPSSILASSVRSKAADILIKKRLIRGLENNGNTCFINVILQSLMSCDPFRKLALSGEVEEGMLLEKFGHLAWEMTEEASKKSIHNDFASEVSFLPKWFFGIFKPSEAMADRHSGTQEDAEEFLSFILNKLQDQEVARIKGCLSGSKYDECNSGWQNGFQGQRLVDTSISYIFGGSSISEVRRASQEPSLTEASFFSLSLDVDLDPVNSILEALRSYCASEVISDEVGKGGMEMRIEKQMFLTKIPKILILHLKRFSYDGVTHAPKKVTKEIRFPEVLELPDSIRRAKGNGHEMKGTYELVAVVTHLGLRLAGGHYYCDVRFRKADDSSIWVKCDDAILKEVELEEVLQRDAYVLFYCVV